MCSGDTERCCHVTRDGLTVAMMSAEDRKLIGPEELAVQTHTQSTDLFMSLVVQGLAGSLLTGLKCC